MTQKRKGQAQETGTLLDAAIADLQAQEGVDAPQRAREVLAEVENQKVELTSCGYDDREPDDHLGFLAFDWLTMGQLLSLPLILVGVVLMVIAYRRGTTTAGT